jgi:hypothetical protein
MFENEKQCRSYVFALHSAVQQCSLVIGVDSGKHEMLRDTFSSPPCSCRGRAAFNALKLSRSSSKPGCESIYTLDDKFGDNVIITESSG